MYKVCTTNINSIKFGKHIVATVTADDRDLMTFVMVVLVASEVQATVDVRLLLAYCTKSEQTL